MALVISGGIQLSGQININVTPPALSGPIFSYNMGNSASFNGQGFDLSYGNFIGSGSNLQGPNWIFDTAADYANGSYGNIGFYYNDNIEPGPLDTFPAGNTFVNHGPLSYLAFNGLPSDAAPGTGQYIDSNLNENTLPAGSSYTIFSVVRVNDFGPPTSPSTWTGGIVAGAQIGFGFVPAGVAPVSSNYPILYANNNLLSNPDGVFDYLTQFQPNTWYAVALTYDADSQTMKIYVNGTPTALTGGIGPTTNADPLYWGTWEGINWLNGDLAVMTTWDRALSASEISSYTTTYGAPYGVTSARQDNDMPIQTYSQLYSEPGEYIFTVPAGVTSISMVGVGAGGGGSESGYSQPGGDTYMYSRWDQNTTGFSPTNSGTNTSQLVFNCSTPPTNSIIGNVAPGWLVTSSQLDNTYPNRAINQGSVYAVVTSIDTNDLSNVTVNLNLNIDTITGGVTNFFFQGQGLLGAQGAIEGSGGSGVAPSTRAMPLIGTGGRGGVMDYFDTDSTGGAGAGGYGTNASIVAFDPNQTYIYANVGTPDTGLANVTLNLSNNNLSVAATANNTTSGIATGTYPISTSAKVMFSLVVDSSADLGNQGIGVGFTGANLVNYTGADANSVCFYSDGNVYYNDSIIATGTPTFGTGDVVDLALDTANAAAWLRVNGGEWNNSPLNNPTTGIGPQEIISGNTLYLMTSQGDSTNIGQWSINTSNAYPIPSGYTFIAGHANAGSTGGDGAYYELQTNKAGQGDGSTVGGSGGGGGGICYNTGTGGGGTGLYGLGAPGARGAWAGTNVYNESNVNITINGAGGGSPAGNSGTVGGVASSWAGGAGGWPGGGGGSGVDYYCGGGGGALAYVNNLSVTPGQTYNVVVGQGGYGSGTGIFTDFYSAGVGGAGAVRIVWPGNTRTFPSTDVGLDPAGPTTLTINPNDLKNGSDTPVSSFTIGSVGTIGNTYQTLYPNSNAIAQAIFAFFRQLGLYTQNSLNNPNSPPPNDPNNFNAYIFNVTWAAGSQVLSGQIRMGYNANTGEINLSPVDTGSSDWQIPSPLTYQGPSNPNLAGTFNFPATFTLYSPTTEANGNYWC
jgi:hypothetical protein